MMQPRYWLDRQQALNPSALRELIGSLAPQRSGQASSNFEKSTSASGGSDRASA
jgi:hypothetical protein